MDDKDRPKNPTDANSDDKMSCDQYANTSDDQEGSNPDKITSSETELTHDISSGIVDNSKNKTKSNEPCHEPMQSLLTVEHGDSDSTFKMPTFGSKPSFKIKSSLPSSINVLKDVDKPVKRQEPIEEKATKSIDKNPAKHGDTETEQTKVSDIKPTKEKSVDGRQSSKHDKLKALSPAEQLKQANISVPYKEPGWGGMAESPYSFEVLKNGQIIDTIDLSAKSFHVCGRLPSCDLTMEHPSLSRHHAVIQYAALSNDKYPVGWYLYDLDSTHGTWVNKSKLKPKVYYRLRVGYVLKFGGSSRLYILQGPDDDQGEESDLSLTEMKELREKQKKAAEILRQSQEEDEEEEGDEKDAEDDGCMWGIDKEDAVDPDLINPFSTDVATDLSEELYLEDPKKTLRGWFEREGYDLPEYEAEEVSFSKHRCRLELPLDTVTGEPIIAEAVVAGKKKEAVAACALEACRILDRHGVLRQAQHESRKKKKKDWEKDDFYDSDEDTFLDRTGAIEKKRQARMKRVGKTETKSETYQSLVDKLTSVEKEIAIVEKQLEKAKAEKDARDQATDEDALDVYMTAIRSGAMDTKTKIKLKSQLFELRKEEQRLRKLANVARPASMPELKKCTSGGVAANKSLPMFGKMKSRASRLPVFGPSKAVPPSSKRENSDNIVEEEDEEEGSEEKTCHEEASAPDEASVRQRLEPPGNEKTCHEEASTPEKASVRQRLEPPSNKKTCHEEASTPEKASVRQRLEASNDEAETTSDRCSAMDVDAQERVVSPEKTHHPICVENMTESKINEELEKKDVSPEKQPAKRPQKVVGPQKTKKPREKVSKEYCEDDPDYAVWVPPTGQTGDGRTHLNDKFGY